MVREKDADIRQDYLQLSVQSTAPGLDLCEQAHLNHIPWSAFSGRDDGFFIRLMSIGSPIDQEELFRYSNGHFLIDEET